MFLKELLFPRRCFGCGYLGVYICPSCISRLIVIKEQKCLFCKKNSLHGLTHPSCKNKTPISGAISLFFYNPTMKKIMKGIKYSLIKEGVSDLQYLLGRFGREELLFYKKKDSLFIQPIPLSLHKEQQRGFNQSLLISQHLSYLLKIPLLLLLKKERDTQPQAQTHSHKERKKNIQGSFQLKKHTSVPQNILLVDDVITSGATIQEAARILKKGGAKEIFVFSIAKG